MERKLYESYKKQIHKLNKTKAANDLKQLNRLRKLSK